MKVFDLDAPEGAGAAVVDDDVIRVDLEEDLITVDPVSGKVLTRVKAPTGPFMAPDGRWLWASDFGKSTTYRLNPDTGAVAQTITAVDKPEGVLIADGSLWVANHHGGSVDRLDRATGAVLATIVVGPEGPAGPQTLVADERYLYVTVPNINTLVRIDMSNNSVAGSVKIPPPAVPCGRMTLDGKAVWVSSCASSPTVARVDFAAGSAVVSQQLGGYVGVGVVSDGTTWLPVAREDGEARLTAFDDSAQVVAEYGIPAGGIDGAVGLDALWIPAPDGQLVKVPLTSIPKL